MIGGAGNTAAMRVDTGRKINIIFDGFEKNTYDNHQKAALWPRREDMDSDVQQQQISEVFTGVQAHLLTAELIRRHSTNRADIREAALAGLDLRSCRRILDLGCGFGFFSLALRDRVPPTALLTGLDMVPAYESLFLDVCRDIKVSGRFIAAPVSHIATLPDRSFDLILCSYALYFFPEVAPHLARLLEPDGVFVTITHAEQNMRELFAAAKDVLRDKGILDQERLPVEEIVSRFCAENGRDILTPWFKSIATIDYLNTLIFEADEVAHLFSYFQFKSPFFLTGIDLDREETMALFAVHLEELSRRQDGFKIYKDDCIFVCREPVFPEREP